MKFQIYVEMLALKDRFFNTHFDFSIAEKDETIRFTLTNMTD